MKSPHLLDMSRLDFLGQVRDQASLRRKQICKSIRILEAEGEGDISESERRRVADEISKKTAELEDVRERLDVASTLYRNCTATLGDTNEG